VVLEEIGLRDVNVVVYAVEDLLGLVEIKVNPDLLEAA
jgi:hypothetical protein